MLEEPQQEVTLLRLLQPRRPGLGSEVDRNAQISLPMPNAMPGPRFRGQIAMPGFSSDATYIAKPGNRFLGRNAV